MTLIDRIAPTQAGGHAVDVEIRRGAEGILSWLLRSPADDIRILVDPDGRVVLEGTLQHGHQRRIIERRMLGLAHVVSVDNRIQVPTDPYPEDLREQLLEAVRSDEVIDPTRIYVSTIGATVHLDGTVPSPEQRALAGRIILRHPAVHALRNNLRILRSHL
ncbi:BON domain-containing protein [Herbiconiux sp.]|uniref:BON domain-containing protein n=1 Tax=Herbiconiux sp. TaxID=1871186 RepID=UPI0025C2937C|nr:BON domain-containing protein [Herbiconiux sp.]